MKLVSFNWEGKWWMTSSRIAWRKEGGWSDDMLCRELGDVEKITRPPTIISKESNIKSWSMCFLKMYRKGQIPDMTVLYFRIQSFDKSRAQTTGNSGQIYGRIQTIGCSIGIYFIVVIQCEESYLCVRFEKCVVLFKYIDDKRQTQKKNEENIDGHFIDDQWRIQTEAYSPRKGLDEIVKHCMTWNMRNNFEKNRKVKDPKDSWRIFRRKKRMSSKKMIWNQCDKPRLSKNYFRSSRKIRWTRYIRYVVRRESHESWQIRVGNEFGSTGAMNQDSSVCNTDSREKQNDIRRSHLTNGSLHPN